jgi:hypothetical protein
MDKSDEGIANALHNADLPKEKIASAENHAQKEYLTWKPELLLPARRS